MDRVFVVAKVEDGIYERHLEVLLFEVAIDSLLVLAFAALTFEELHL
jgi:hypothetical protein